MTHLTTRLENYHILISLYMLIFWSYFTKTFKTAGPNQQFYGQQPYPPPPPTGFNQGYNPAYPHQVPSQQPIDPSNNMYSGYRDPEDDAKNFDFNDESVRRGFIKKVYSLLCVSFQLKLHFYSYLMQSIIFLFNSCNYQFHSASSEFLFFTSRQNYGCDNTPS